jgi:hypothetical protein
MKTWGHGFGHGARRGHTSVRRAAAAASLAIAAGAAGCGDDKACAEVTCPSVGEEAAPGDYRVPLGGNDKWSFVDLSLATMSASAAFSEFSLLGGELVFTKPVCAADGTCRTSMKKVRLDLEPFSMQFSDGSHLSYDAGSISYEAPIALEQQGMTYAVPVGTETHGCVRVNGRSWHATAASTVPLLIRIDDMRQLLDINGVFPLVVRADDASCTTVALQGRVTASATLPWTLAGVDGGSDASP